MWMIRIFGFDLDIVCELLCMASGDRVVFGLQVWFSVNRSIFMYMEEPRIKIIDGDREEKE